MNSGGLSLGIARERDRYAAKNTGEGSGRKASPKKAQFFILLRDNQAAWIFERERTKRGMTPEKKRKIAKVLSLIVSIDDIAVMTGWIFDISIPMSISPVWSTMKFDSAVAFVVGGITLYFMVRSREGESEKAQVALSITSLVIIFVMGILFFSALLGIQTGAEDLFIKTRTAL